MNKDIKNTTIGIVHILATFNNTIITLSNLQGEVLSWSSSGSNGFKGAKKSTPYAAQTNAKEIVKKIKSLGIKTISVNICGPGNGRESAIKGLISSGMNITTITDVTSIPHNGCRPPKKRKI
jgi:small subunit ribosomal protein S11